MEKNQGTDMRHDKPLRMLAHLDMRHAASREMTGGILQRDYHAVTGHTVLESIQNEKLERVKDMLRKTATPIDAIGPFCGFKSPAHLKTLFKNRFGMTMSSYRISST